MDLQKASGLTPLQQIARRVGQELHGRGILAPQWLVQALVEQHLNGAHPSVAPEMHSLDTTTMEALATTVADHVITEMSMPDSTGSPAVLNLADAGRLITALGVTTHCALINASQLQPELGAILGRTASCMMTIGSAAQDAHRAGDAMLLLPPEALELARQALSGTLAELLAGRWAVVGDEDARNAILIVLRDGLSRLRTT